MPVTFADVCDRHAGAVRVSAILLRVLEQGRNSGSGAALERVAKAPFYMLVFGALLTAFYMTRQVSYVFFGNWRGHGHAHESPQVMTMPLAILAFFAVALGAIGTPAWPWFRAFLEGHAATFDLAGLSEPGLMALMVTSSVVVLAGLGSGLVDLWRTSRRRRRSRMRWSCGAACHGRCCATSSISMNCTARR